MSVNYYDILEINKDASDNDIRKSFKKLALKWHPDKNQDNLEIATKKFKEISEAYQVLSDPSKRKQYDLHGSVNFDDINFKNPEEVFELFIVRFFESDIFSENGLINNIMESPEISIMFNSLNNIPKDQKDYVKSTYLNENTFLGKTFNNLRQAGKKINLEDKISNILGNIKKQQTKTSETSETNGTNEANEANETKENDSSKKQKIKHKPDDILCNLEVTMSEIYNKRVKKIKFNRTVNKNNICKNEEKILMVPLLSREYIFYNQGDDLDGYQESGDILVSIDVKNELSLSMINKYDILYKKEITIYEFLNGLKFVIPYFNNEYLEIETERIGNYFIQKIPGYGMPKSKKNNKRGDLYVRFFINFDNDEEINKVNEILPTKNEYKQDDINKDKIVYCTLLPILEKSIFNI